MIAREWVLNDTTKISLEQRSDGKSMIITIDDYNVIIAERAFHDFFEAVEEIKKFFEVEKAKENDNGTE